MREGVYKPTYAERAFLYCFFGQLALQICACITGSGAPGALAQHLQHQGTCCTCTPTRSNYSTGL